MTAGPFCWQIDQMRERLNTLKFSFQQQHSSEPRRSAAQIRGLEELLDQLEVQSSEIFGLLDQQTEPGTWVGLEIEGEMITDERGVIVEASEGMAALVNVPIPALEGRPWGIYLDQRSTDLFQTITKRLMRGEVIHSAELHLRPRNRSPCPVAVKAKPLIDSTGTIEGAHWQVRVVPERQKVHHSLQAAEERFLIAAKSTQDLVYEHEIVTDLVRWFGRTEDQYLYPVTGNGWQEAVHPDDREQVKRATIGHLKTGAPFAEEYRLRLRDGRTIVIADRATAIRDHTGKPLRWVGAVVDITAQRAAEQALQKSEERFRTMAETFRDGLTIVEEGRIVYMNDQAVTIFGYPREELLQMNPIDIAEPGEVPLLTCLLDEFKRTRITPETIEYWIRQKDGSRHCIQNRFTAYKNGLYSVITIDITQRRLADELSARYAEDLELKNEELGAAAAHLRRLTADLDHQKRWLHGILAAIPEEIVIIGRDLRFSYVNPPAATAVNLRAEEIIGKTWQEVGKMADVGLPFSDQVAKVFGDGVAAKGQFSRHVDGTIRHLSYIMSPVYGQTGAIEAVLTASRDVTEQVVMEEALADSERRYRSLVDLAPDVIAIHQQGRFVYLNPAGAGLFGAEAADCLIGTELTALIHPRDQELVSQRIRDMMDGTMTTTPPIEVRVIRLDGTPVSVELTSAMIPYNAGQAIHSMLRDITPRKKAENELKIVNQELRQSNRDLEQFAYVASHDLNQPLRTIISYIQLLEKHYKPMLCPDAQEMMGFIVDGGERMQEMIADLLDYSRITRKESTYETVDCEDLLRKTLGQLGHLIAEEEAEVTHDQLPCVRGDAGLLQQVFLNLITNAIKFHGPSSPQVHISASRSREAWTFAFSDNGIGVPADAQERIFLMFQRLHTQADFPGTGIGLAICRKVIERHGGSLWVESDQGRGSRFLFTIPTHDLHGDGQVPGLQIQERGQS